LLRRQDFKIDRDIGVGFLFDKLLKEPLAQRGARDAFIIIDGLDEADCITLDSTMRPARPEMEILLEHLASLPSAHLLFVSRGEADVTRIIPNSTTKRLERDDNMEDINSYIRQKLDVSKRLKTHFENERLDPVKYFSDKAKGVFLWVVVVLHQLQQIKYTSEFLKTLNNFSHASGDMALLYATVLCRIADKDRKWVQEILKWVVAEENLKHGTLREAVEWVLQDHIPD
jgi:hypothetical protein